MGLLLTASGTVVLAADVRCTSFLTPFGLKARIEKGVVGNVMGDFVWLLHASLLLDSYTEIEHTVRCAVIR